MRLLADPLAGLSIARGVRIVAWAVSGTFLLVSVATGLTYRPFYADPYLIGASVALALPLVAGVWGLRSPQGPLRALQVFVALSCVLQVADAFAATLPAGSVDYPPLSHVLAAGRIVAGVVFLPRAGVPLVLVSTAAVALERSLSVGTPQAIGELAIFLVAGLQPFVLMSAIRGELERLRLSTAASVDASSRARAAAQESLAHQQLDGLIHDKVLAALNLAARGRSTEAAGLAADALVHLTPGGTGEPRSVAEGSPARIVAHASALGLDLTFLSTAWPPGPPGEALRAATCEALTNVAKHAGTQRATVQGIERGGVFMVEVRDHGRGFDPDAVGAGRLGVRDRIVGTMASVGGAARIESSSGTGTRVVLSWTRPASGDTQDPLWLPRVLTALTPLIAVSLAGYVAIGAVHLTESLSPAVVMAGLMLVPLLTALVGTVRLDGPAWRPTLAGIVVVWAALLVNVDHPDAADWRTWFIGGFNWAIGLVAARRGGRTASIVAACATTIGLAGLVVRGETSFVPVLASTVQVFGWAIGIGWLKSIADASDAQASAVLTGRQEAEAEAAEAAALRAEIVARQQGLDAGVLPLMRAIASGMPLSSDDRRRCVSVEASTRDQLVARTLLTPALGEAIARARTRGARVTITGRASPGDPLDAFRQAALSLARAGQSGDRLTLRWAPDGAGTLATCVLVGEDAASRDLGVTALLPGADITADADAVLVRILAPAEPTGA